MKKPRIRAVSPRVYMVGGSGLSHRDDCCVYLLDGGSSAALVDCGTEAGTGRILDNIQAAGLQPDVVDTIIVTHGHIDHIGGLRALQRALSAHTWAHQLELPAVIEGRPELTAADWYSVTYQPGAVHTVLKGDQGTIDLGELQVHWLHTPGHTPGGISLYVDIAGTRILFGQDIHGPFNAAWGSDTKQWRASMQKLLALKADILCEGHYGVITPEVRVRNYIEGYLQRFK